MKGNQHNQTRTKQNSVSLAGVRVREICGTGLGGAELSMRVNSLTQQRLQSAVFFSLCIVWVGIFHLILHLHLQSDATEWHYVPSPSTQKQHVTCSSGTRATHQGPGLILVLKCVTIFLLQSYMGDKRKALRFG